MNNTFASKELIDQYRNAEDPAVAIDLAEKIKDSIKTMTAEEKAALSEQLDGNVVEEPAPPTETFEAGQVVVDKPQVIEQVEIPETEVVVPPAVEAADTEILKEIEAVVPEIAKEDAVEAKMEEGEQPPVAEGQVDASAPIDFEKARERILAGNPDAISATECEEGEAAWYNKIAA